MIHLSPPADFNPKFEVVSCFLERNGTFLLLRRHDHKPQGGTWGAPAGKVGENESPVSAMVRELREETGILVSENDLKLEEKLYVRYEDYDFTYYTFRLAAPSDQAITLNPEEHTEYAWVTPEASLALPLIQDMDECIRLFYKLPSPS